MSSSQALFPQNLFLDPENSEFLRLHWKMMPKLFLSILFGLVSSNEVDKRHCSSFYFNLKNTEINKSLKKYFNGFYEFQEKDSKLFFFTFYAWIFSTYCREKYSEANYVKIENLLRPLWWAAIFQAPKESLKFIHSQY